jgi:replicative DNA helicase
MRPVEPTYAEVDKLPPVSVESEDYVLGACLWHRDAISEVADVLKPEYFFSRPNGVRFRGMLELYAQNITIDVKTLLVHNKRHVGVGGPLNADKLHIEALNLSLLETGCSGKREVLYHALIVVQCYIKREQIRIHGEALAESYTEGLDALDHAAETVKRLEAVVMGAVRPRSRAFAEYEKEELTAAGKASDDSTKPKVHVTGFHALDKVVGGYSPGDLIIVAGRPGMGKSAFMVSSMVSGAEAGHRSLAFSMELPQPKMQARIVSYRSPIPLAAMVHERMTPEEIQRRHVGLASAATLPLFIRYDTGLSVNAIRAEVERTIRREKITCVFIDQLNWIEPEKSNNRDAEVGKITRGLKNMATQLNVAVVLLHQLKRDVESRGGDKRPRLSDLRDSGNVEQDAQQVLLLYRPDYYGVPDSVPNAVEVIVAKNSNGSCETVQLTFQKEHAAMRDSMIQEPLPF